jgi:hypothetical protein
VSAISALAGSVIGGLTSGYTTWLTQRSQARAGNPALGQDLTRSFACDAIGSSEHHVELIDCPISMSFAMSRVCLELRSLPSAGVTRFPRYYEPLRHPTGKRRLLTAQIAVIPGGLANR